MNELLRKRINRRLDNLADAQGYQVLDYIEFLETKYGTGERASSPVEKISDAVEDTMRAVRLPAAAIRGTMGAVDSASSLMDRLAQAGKAAVDELGKTLAEVEAPEPAAPPPASTPPEQREDPGASA